MREISLKYKLSNWTQPKTNKPCLFFIRCEPNNNILHLSPGQLMKLDGYYRPSYEIDLPKNIRTLCKIDTSSWVVEKFPKLNMPTCADCARKSHGTPIYAGARKDNGGTGKKHNPPRNKT